MGGEQAAGVLTTVKQEGLKSKGKSSMTKEEVNEFERPILEKYKKEGNAYYSTSRLWDDGIIDPRDTRKIIGECLNIISDGDKRELKPNTFGVARM